MNIDLHVHSTHSDGTYSPRELVDYAIQKNLKAFALTDHDGIDGLDEAIAYAESLTVTGAKNVPEIVPGIEISTEYCGKDVHILGLYIDYKCPVFVEYISNFIASREHRNETMCAKLCADGINITYEALKKRFPNSVITRAHYARMMAEEGYVNNPREAFDKCIGDTCKYYVPREKIKPEFAVEFILKCGGVPILAHPILYHFSDARLEQLISMLKESGLMGIEAVYSTYAPAEERLIRGFAQKYHLLLSGGSDFHGANKPDIDLGVGYGKLYIPEEFLDAIKASRKKLLFTDLDGTLFLSDSTISPAMKDALDRFTAAGHKLILTSGRPLPSMLERKIKLGLNYSNMFIISNNGALIYDCEKGEAIQNIKLSQNLVRRIVAIADKYKVHVHSYTDSEIVGYREDEETLFYRKRIHMPFVKVDNIADYLSDGSFKVQIISLDGREKLEPVKEAIFKELGNEVEIFFSNDYYLEILPQNIDKGSAIITLTDYLSMSRANTYAAGDADNDITMIRAAAHGIAMKNASDNVKAVASIITENDNDHDGLIEILNQI